MMITWLHALIVLEQLRCIHVHVAHVWLVLASRLCWCHAWVWTCVVYRSSNMVEFRIWAKELIVISVSNITMRDIMHLDVSLAKLIQNGPGSLGINSGYLCHYLPVALAIRILSNSLGYLARTNLRWWVFVWVTIGSKSLILDINNSILFESGSHYISSVLVTSIVPIFSVLF